MRILITGATGFIGRHLVERLAPDHQVFALVRKLPPTPISGVRFIAQDLRFPLDHDRLPSCLDAIIHQAALIHTENAQDDADPFAVNVIATWRLLSYARTVGVDTFVHASTGGVYGCSPTPLDENARLNPMDLYSLTKAQAELAVQSAPGSFHRVVLRYCFPYGVGTPNPIPDYVRRAVRGETIEIIEGGGPSFNPIHISDAVEATIQALSLGRNITVNVAGTENTTFERIARMAAQIAGREERFRSISLAQAIPYYRSDLVASIKLMRETLPLSQVTSLLEGVTELAGHYLENSEG